MKSMDRSAASSPPRPTLRRGVDKRIVSLVVLMAGVAVAVHSLWLTDLSVLDRPLTIPWWMLALGFALAELLVFHVRVGRDAHTISLAEIPLLLGLSLASPLTLIVGRLIGSAATLTLHRRQQPLKLSFNLSLFYLETVAAIAVYRVVLGAHSPNSVGGYLAAGAALAAAHVVSAALVNVVISWRQPGRSRADIARTLAGSFLVTVTAAVVGILGLIGIWRDPRMAVAVVGAGILVYVVIASHRRRALLLGEI